MAALSAEGFQALTRPSVRPQWWRWEYHQPISRAQALREAKAAAAMAREVLGEATPRMRVPEMVE